MQIIMQSCKDFCVSFMLCNLCTKKAKAHFNMQKVETLIL